MAASKDFVKAVAHFGSLLESIKDSEVGHDIDSFEPWIQEKCELSVKEHGVIYGVNALRAVMSGLDDYFFKQEKRSVPNNKLNLHNRTVADLSKVYAGKVNDGVEAALGFVTSFAQSQGLSPLATIDILIGLLVRRRTLAEVIELEKGLADVARYAAAKG